MEKEFQNVFTASEKAYRQAFRRQLVGMSGLQMVILPAALGILLLLSFSVGLTSEGRLFGPSNATLVITDLVLLIFMGGLCFLMPWILGRMTMRKLAESYKGTVVMKTVFTDQGIHYRNEASGGELDLSYDTILRCGESRDLLLLQTKNRQMLPLDKNGFTPADVDAFKAFLQGKALTAKCVWKK